MIVVVMMMWISTMMIMTVIRPTREETRRLQVMIVFRMVMAIMFSSKRGRTWAYRYLIFLSTKRNLKHNIS